MNDPGNKSKLENKLSFSAPIKSFIERSFEVRIMLTSLMLCVLALTFFLAYILINQLVRGSIRSKTYENAMLRCLGWNQMHILFVMVSKILIFYAVPAMFLGLTLAKALNISVEKTL